jgi:hypothetical protein
MELEMLLLNFNDNPENEETVLDIKESILRLQDEENEDNLDVSDVSSVTSISLSLEESEDIDLDDIER